MDRLKLKAPGEGQGSAFIVRLPILSTPVEISPMASDAPAALSAKRRFLIVDDNKDSADSLALLLEITGNKTYMAHDDVKAFEAIEKHRPEVVLLDIGLPACPRAALGGRTLCSSR